MKYWLVHDKDYTIMEIKIKEISSKEIINVNQKKKISKHNASEKKVKHLIILIVFLTICF